MAVIPNELQGEIVTHFAQEQEQLEDKSGSIWLPLLKSSSEANLLYSRHESDAL